MKTGLGAVRAGIERLNAGRQAFELDLASSTESAPPPHNAVVASSRCEVLAEADSWLRFDILRVEAFAAMLLARLVEPASKAAAVGILRITAWPPRTGTLRLPR